MVREIVLFPAEVLLRPCTKVTNEELESEFVKNLCVDLRDTTCSIPNVVGLAANQIGVSKCVFAVKGLGVLINPEIVKLKGTRQPDIEGCLSIPGIDGYVFRHSKIEVSYIRLEPKGPVAVTNVLTGFTARVFQHEMDHLLGKVFIDKIDIVSAEKFKGEIELLKRPEND